MIDITQVIGAALGITAVAIIRRYCDRDNYTMWTQIVTAWAVVLGSSVPLIIKTFTIN